MRVLREDSMRVLYTSLFRKRVFSASTRFFSASMAAATLAIGLTAGTASAQKLDDTIRVGISFLAGKGGQPGQATVSPNVYTLSPLYDSLTMVSQQGRTIGLLAESWNSIDDTTWVFHLRPGVLFHNGERFDADAVVAWFSFLLTDEGRATRAGTRVRTNSRLASVRKIDDMTVEFTTDGPNPVLPKAVGETWIPAPKAYADLGDQGFAREPVGTGSYKVVRWREEQVEFEAFEKAWRPAKVQKLLAIGLQERARRLQGILSGELDIAMGMSLEEGDQLEAAGHMFDASRRPSVLAWRMFQTSRESPFNDLRVRQAANYAINRQEMVDVLLRGLTRAGSQAAVSFAFGYNPHVEPYPYDPDLSKRLLAEAGFPNGFDTIVEVVPDNFVGDSDIYQIAAQQLTAVGIRTELRAITNPDWLNKWFPPEDATTLGFVGDMFQLSCHLNFVDGIDCFNTLGCDRVKPPTHYCYPKETELVQKARVEMDPDKRERFLQELMRINHENAAMVFFVELLDITGLHNRVRGFQNHIQRFNYHDVTLEN